MRAPPAVLCLLGVLVACRSGGRVEGKAGHSPSELETEDSGDSAVDPAPEAVPWPFSPDELIEVF